MKFFFGGGGKTCNMGQAVVMRGKKKAKKIYLFNIPSKKYFLLMQLCENFVNIYVVYFNQHLGVEQNLLLQLFCMFSQDFDA